MTIRKGSKFQVVSLCKEGKLVHGFKTKQGAEAFAELRLQLIHVRSVVIADYIQS